MQFQSLWLQSTIVFLEAAAVVFALIVVRRGAVSPLVSFGAVILAARAGTFLLVYLGSGGGTPPAMQVLAIYASIVPSVLLLIYVCLVQARRYRAARKRDRVRTWFLWAPYVHGGAVAGAFVGDLIVEPPILESDRGLPVATFFVEAPDYVTAAIYAGLAACVFFSAARATAAPTGASQRLQNLFWGIAIAGLSVLAVHALVWRGTRAFSSKDLVTILGGRFSLVEYVLLVIIAAGIVLGTFSYHVQGARDRFMERFVDFLDLVSDLAEELAGAPVHKKEFNLPYAAMHEAAGEEFLNLSRVDKRKMDNAFRAKVVLACRAGADDSRSRRERFSRRRLADLAKAYEDELNEPVLADGLRREVCVEELPDTLRDVIPEGSREGGRDAAERQGLREAVALVAKAEGTKDVVSPSSPEWEQLVCVALADAALLPGPVGENVREGVSKSVLGAYLLVLYKLQRYYGRDEGDGKEV